MLTKSKSPLPGPAYYVLLFLAGMLCGYSLRNARTQKPRRSGTTKKGVHVAFPTNALDPLKHSQMIKDYISQQADWWLTDVKLFAGDKLLSEATTGAIKSFGTNLQLQLNQPVDAAKLASIAQEWVAGQVILDDFQPQATGKLAEGILLTADFPPNATDFELTSGAAIPLTSCSLESPPPLDSQRIIFGYLTGLPHTFKARRILGQHSGIELFIWAVGGRDDYCRMTLDGTCAGNTEQVAEAVEFALSLFFGTRVEWRTLTTVDQQGERSWFSLKDLHLAAPFPPPLENSSELDDDDVANIIHTFLQYHLQKGYSAANYFLHQCWELSPSTQLSARVLTVAVAIEGICRSVLLSLEKDRDPLFEDIFEQIEGITDSWVASAQNEDEGDASARRNIKKRISDLLGKRNELGGKALIERAFAQIGCPISPDELQIWNKARNATAHAAFKRKSPSQAILDQYFTCVGLLYRFILTNMGYHGDFINYTSKSWPNETM